MSDCTINNLDDDEEWAESISISYRGHDLTMSATLSAKAGLKAESAYEWLLRAVRSIGFEQLAELIEKPEDE